MMMRPENFKAGDRVLVTRCGLNDFHNGQEGILQGFDFPSPVTVFAKVRMLQDSCICWADDIEPVTPTFNVLEQLQEDQKWWNSNTVHAPYRDEASNRAFKAGVLHGLNLAIGYLENGPD